MYWLGFPISAFAHAAGLVGDAVPSPLLGEILFICHLFRDLTLHLFFPLKPVAFGCDSYEVYHIQSRFSVRGSIFYGAL